MPEPAVKTPPLFTVFCTPRSATRAYPSAVVGTGSVPLIGTATTTLSPVPCGVAPSEIPVVRLPVVASNRTLAGRLESVTLTLYVPTGTKAVQSPFISVVAV